MEYWVGKHIREARLQMGYTQTAFGKFIGHGQSYISNMETGDIDPPFHEVVELLRQAGRQLPSAPDDEPPTPGPENGRPFS